MSRIGVEWVEGPKFEARETTPPGGAVQWVIYKKPIDAPGHWVVRRWEILQDGTIEHGAFYLCDDLAEARWRIPKDAIVLPRAASDDPVIYEVWL